jgi:hypothetical protein
MLSVFVPGVCLAQLSGGTITGVVRDASGAVITGAPVQTVHRATGQARLTITADRGEYSFPALLPGEYEISVEAVGFQRIARAATVEAGTTTRADFALRVGDLSDSVTVQAASPQIHYDSPSVGGVITRDQIQGVPLNGRSFLELAKLEPGVQPPTGTNRNRTVVPILSAPAPNVGGARFTVDGGSVTSVGLGGAQMGFSQELVQEFQVSTVNFDLSAGMTDAGAINVVTRAGGNEFQATTFYFFRDHNLAAYPALNRDGSNPDPFFQRQQFGFALGGPIRRDRVFYFGNWERNDQRAVAGTTLLTPDFAHLSRITSNPLIGTLFSARLDAKINSAHTVFVRHSRDASRAFGPGATIGGGSPNAYPSNWNRVVTGADQSLLAVTSVLRPTLVNDVRVSFFTVSSQSGAAREDDCRQCLGLGGPSITVALTGLVIGNSTATDNLERRFHFTDAITWQRSTHRARFGLDWEHNRDRNLIWSNEPVTMTLFSPGRVRSYNAQPGIPPEQRIPLPASFTTIGDILQLPLQTMNIGIGEPGVPQEHGGVVRRWNTIWLYAEDAWRLRDRVTLTYGVGWGSDGILNHDLRKPPLLAPLLGSDGLGPTRRNWTNFSPSAGVIWTASSDRKTVVRAGAGHFYRPHGLTSQMDAERVALGPPGLGRQNFAGSSILNPIPGIPDVPVGTSLDFRNSPTLFTGADLMAIVPPIRAAQSQILANADRSVQQIQITKQQAAPNTAIFPADAPNPSAVHLNLGLQRELRRGMVLSADVVYRRFTHVPQNGGTIDVNHYTSVRGSVIRGCTPAESTDPGALCSRGAINVYVAPYRFTYKGLLLRAERRFSGGFQVLGSYAYSRNSGTNAGVGFNLENWLENTGPTPTDVTHVVNLAGVVRLPWRFDLGLNVSYSSVPPFSAFVGGIDLNGDGTTGDLLPGTTVSAFNRGMGRADLERFVGQFNESHPGIPPLTLPAHYSFGDNFQSLDVRLSRSLVIRQRLRVTLIGEAFNLYNASNLSDYSGDLTTSAFGQPTSRVTQVFGSGGPRAFQVAVRVSF